MELVLQRDPAELGAIMGTLFISDQFFCYTLENEADAIELGRYQVVINKSQRSVQGKLWSPKDNLLPELVGVEGRDGIRIHAGDTKDDVEGCIAVGLVKQDDAIFNSRTALALIMVKLMGSGEDNWITIA